MKCNVGFWIGRPLKSLSLFAVAVALSACVVSQQNPPTADAAIPSATPPSAEIEWTAVLEVSGGITGMARTVSLASTGELSVRDERTGKVARSMVPADELASFETLVSAIREHPGEILPPCADCFVYHLLVEMDGRSIAAAMNDINLDSSDLAPLVHALFDLGNGALPL